MNKYHRPESCESLTKVQAGWDNLSIGTFTGRRNAKGTNVFVNGMCALTCMINKLVEQIAPLSVGSELLQEATDASALLGSANTELN